MIDKSSPSMPCPNYVEVATWILFQHPSQSILLCWGCYLNSFSTSQSINPRANGKIGWYFVRSSLTTSIHVIFNLSLFHDGPSTYIERLFLAVVIVGLLSTLSKSSLLTYHLLMLSLNSLKSAHFFLILFFPVLHHD